MSKKRKIILIGNVPPPYSGQSIAFNMIYEAIQKQEEDFFLVNYSETKEIENPSKISRSLFYIKLIIKYLPLLLGGKRTVYLIIAGSRAGFFRDYFFINLAKLLGHKVIAHSHNGYYGEFYKNEPIFFQKRIKNTLGQLDKLIVLGDRLVEQYHFSEKLKKNIVVIPNGLPWEVDNKELEAKILPISKDIPIKILYLSNLMEAKGYLDLLEAINILVNNHNVNIHCTFAGKFWMNPKQDEKFETVEEAQSYFNQYIKEHHLEKHAEYIGVISGDNKVEAIKESHFFALPTYYYIEAQPLSIIETMAYGVVPISTNYRVIPKLISDKKNGLFVEPKSPLSIANAILECIDNPALYTSMSKESIHKVNTQFSKKKHVESVLSIFNQI